MTPLTSFHVFEDDNSFETFAAGDVIFREGDTGEVMYVIKEGDIEILIGDTVVNHIGRGDILGEMALINTKVRSATAIAKTEAKLVPINERQFKFLIQEHPFFALDVMSVLANRLRRRVET